MLTQRGSTNIRLEGTFTSMEGMQLPIAPATTASQYQKQALEPAPQVSAAKLHYSEFFSPPARL
jgi:hypothetical protein